MTSLNHYQKVVLFFMLKIRADDFLPRQGHKNQRCSK